MPMNYANIMPPMGMPPLIGGAPFRGIGGIRGMMGMLPNFGF